MRPFSGPHAILGLEDDDAIGDVADVLAPVFASVIATPSDVGALGGATPPQPLSAHDVAAMTPTMRADLARLYRAEASAILAGSIRAKDPRRDAARLRQIADVLAPNGVHPLAGLSAEQLVEIADFAGLSVDELVGLDDEEIAGLFDGIAKALGSAAKAVGGAVSDVAKGVGKAVGGAASAIDKAYVAVTPQWLRKGAGVVAGTVFAPQKFVVDSVDNLARGQRVDRAIMGAVKGQVEVFKTVAPIAQLGLSFVPGVGQGVSAVLGTAIALAEGKPITDGLIAAVKGAIPGGPLAQKALDVGARAAIDVAQGKRLDTAAIEALRNQIPGGDAAKIAFDTGLALAQGKKLQDAARAGIDVAASKLLPKTPLAQGAFELTKAALAGKPIPGAPPAPKPATMTAALRFARPTTLRAPLVATVAPKRINVAHMRTLALRPTMTLAAAAAAPPPEKPEAKSEKKPFPTVPVVVGGVVVLAAAGGATWWAMRRRDA